MRLSTSDPTTIKPFLNKLHIPLSNSHKGQNGKVLIIGGSSLFHASPIWSAEAASHFVDMVHFASTKENNEIFLQIKKQFKNGIVISQQMIPDYVREDDALLIGPGMVRGEKKLNDKLQILNFNDIIKIEQESSFTYEITKYLIEQFPQKKFVFDAGALQMMEKEWLQLLKTPAIVTPHQKEFNSIFGIDIEKATVEEKKELVNKTARKHKCIIMLKAIVDIISDGKQTYVIEGGNAGLTKGGTGDILAGITCSLYALNDAITSSVLASYIIKSTADILQKEKGYWYNNDDILSYIPRLLQQLMFDNK